MDDINLPPSQEIHENGLHHRRDVTFHEDATRLTPGQAGHNMAILNNLVIGLCFS